MTTTVKVLFSAAGLAVLAASPVFAATHVRQHAPVAAHTPMVVAPNGQVIGTDPDPRIRQDLLRDWGANEGYNR